MFQDLTSLIVSIGYGGDDAPKIITPSYVGSSATAMIPEAQQMNAGSNQSNKYIVGSKFNTNFSGNIEAHSIFNANTAARSSEDHYQIDFDKYQAFIQQNLSQTMHVNLSDYSVLLSQEITGKNQQIKQNRAKIAEIMFEKLKVPNIYFCKNPVLSCFATGRSTALVLDSGQNFTRSVAVHDGYALLKSLKCYGLGGKDISLQIQKNIEKLTGKPLLTRFEVGKSDKGIKFPKSFLNFHKKQLIKDIKQHLSVKSNDEAVEQISKIEYELPDHKTITIFKNQILDPFVSPSVFFKNSLSQPQKIFDVSYKGLPQMVIESINACDVDIKKQLFSNFLMTGGNMLYGNLMKQVEQKVNEYAPPNAKVKTVAVCTPAQRKYTEWIGGSIVTSLSSFQSYWVGQQEWKQNGPSIIEKKCP